MSKSLEGQRVPAANFKYIDGIEWKTISTSELFDGKTVIVFSLPGAYTPTCSTSHVPRFNELAGVFFNNGVDEIVCISVNDTFVMNSWKKEQKADNITFIPDGNGEFTEKMGLLVDKSDLGFGKRSWRYSMLVKNGVIEKMFIEPKKDGDPFEVSDADTMLWYINKDAVPPKELAIFTREGCSICALALNLLEVNKIPYEEIKINKDVSSKAMKAIVNKTNTPQVFVGGEYLGSLNELESYIKSLKKV